MANPAAALNIAGNLGTAIAVTGTLNQSAPLPAGVYALWAITETISIGVGAPVSTGLTTTTGLPVYTSAVAPTYVNVPQNYQIGAIGSSSGTLVYQKVG